MKKHPEFSDYIIYEDGKVYSLKVNRFLKPYERPDGYITTYIDDYFKRVHRLVAETYIPNPDNLPEVNHKDCDKSNNHVSNLEWVTSKQNKQHARDHGIYSSGEESVNTELTNEQIHEVCDLMQQGYINKDIVTKTGIPTYTVANIRSGNIWKDISSQYQFTVKRQDRKSESTVLKICIDLETGLSNKEVSEKHGISEQEIRRIRRGDIFPDIVSNFDIPSSKYSRLDKVVVERVCKELSEKTPLSDILDKFPELSKAQLQRIKNRKIWINVSNKYVW